MAMVEQSISKMIPPFEINGIPIQLQAKITFPDLEPQAVGASNWIGFFFFGGLILLGFIGILVEYSNIFGVVDYSDIPESKQDKALLESKSSLGKFFLAFSYSRNMRKMFWTSQRDDDYLTVFNGLRVL